MISKLNAAWTTSKHKRNCTNKKKNPQKTSFFVQLSCTEIIKHKKCTNSQHKFFRTNKMYKFFSNPQKTSFFVQLSCTEKIKHRKCTNSQHKFFRTKKMYKFFLNTKINFNSVQLSCTQKTKHRKCTSFYHMNVVISKGKLRRKFYKKNCAFFVWSRSTF